MIEFENSHPSCAGSFGWRCLLNATYVRSFMTTALLPMQQSELRNRNEPFDILYGWMLFDYWYWYWSSLVRRRNHVH